MHAVGVSAKQPMLLSHAQRQGPFRVRSGHKAIPESGLRRLPGRWARFQGRAGNTFVLGKLNPPPLPFLDLMTYPVKPGHYVRIDLKEPPNQCPLWVISGHFSCQPKMSAFGGKVDINQRHSVYGGISRAPC